MNETFELINFVEQTILRGRKINPNMLSSSSYKEYLSLRKAFNSNSSLKSKKPSSQLRAGLIDIINTVKPSRYKYTSMQRRLIQLSKDRNAAELLMGMGARNGAIELFDHSYKQAKKLDVPKIIFDSSRELFLHKSRFEGKAKKAQKYFDESLLALEKIKNETKVEWYLAKLTTRHTKKKENTEELKELAQLYFEELNQIPLQHRSHKFNRYFTYLGSQYYQITHDLKQLISFLSDKVTQYEKDENRFHTELRIFRTILIQTLLRINQTDDLVLSYIKRNLKGAKSKNNEWFRANELLCLYYLKKKQYSILIEVYESLIAEKNYKSIRLDIKIKLQLNYIYAIIILASKCPPIERKKILKKVKMAKYINSIPNYTTDKKGMNIPVYIASILYYILSGDEKRIEKEFNYLEKYISRYLKTNPLYRSNAFFKMLLQVYKYNYHPNAIRRHANKHILKLSGVSYTQSPHPKEIEEIPYEILWENLMYFLDQKHNRFKDLP